MSVTVRRATEADIPAMSRVLIASITELCAADHGSDPVKLSAWLRNKTPGGVQEMLENPRGQLFVAELDGILGAVGAISNDGQITLNYVAPEMRFRGMSKTLLARLEAELQARGCAEGRLEATATAKLFYEKAGWSVDGPQAEDRAVNGYPMRKTL